jgi:hypothetical protein
MRWLALVLIMGCGRVGYDLPPEDILSSELTDAGSSNSGNADAANGSMANNDQALPVINRAQLVSSPTTFRGLLVGDLAVSTAGNVYVTGNFAGQGSFGGAVVTSAGDEDGYLASFGPDLSPRWEVTWGGSLSDHGVELVPDPSGGVRLLGVFERSIAFEGQPLSSSADDYLLATVRDDKSVTGLQQFGSQGDEGPQGGLAWSSDGELIVATICIRSCNPGGGTLSRLGSQDLVIARFAEDGQFRLASRWSGDFYPKVLETGPNGAVYVGGYFFSSIDFGNGPRTSNGGADLFIASLDRDNNLNWLITTGGPDNDGVQAIEVDPSGNVFAVGHFSQSVDFGGTPLQATGGLDGFAASLSSAGDERWARTIGGQEDDSLADVGLIDDQVVVLGAFSNEMDIADQHIIGEGDQDALLMALSADQGDWLWHWRFGGPNTDFGDSMVILPDRRAILAASIDGVVNIDDGSFGATNAISGALFETVLP